MNLARGGAFSSYFLTGVTTVGPTFVPLIVTAVTDTENVDFIHNGNGELEYTGAATKDFEGVIFLAGRRSSGGAINTRKVTLGIDTGSGFVVHDVTHAGSFMIDSDDSCMSVRYRVTLNTGDKVRPMINCSSNVAWRNRGMSHVLVEEPNRSRGSAYMNPVTNYNTVTTANVWVPLNVTAITDAKNVNFTHHGNGDLEYTGTAEKTFDGYLSCGGRKVSGGGTQNYRLTAGFSDDAGVSYTPIIADRANLMETGQTKNEGLWINYTVTLNTGDRIRPMLHCTSVQTFENYTFDHLILERNL